jgi:predicted transcriptional regulator
MARPKVILEYACISARVRPDIRDAFAILANQKGKTSSALANQIISAYVCNAMREQKTTKKKLIAKKVRGDNP